MPGESGSESAPRRDGPLLGRRARLLVGAALLVAVVLFVWFRLDWRAVVSVVTRAEPALLLAGMTAAVAGLACWSEAMRHLLPPGARGVSRRRGFLVYATGSLVRNAIPLGYASSVVVLGYLYGRETGLPLERSLAGVSVAEFVNAVASTGLAVAGVFLLAAVGPSSPVVPWLAVVGAAVALGGAVGGSLLWYRRETVERAVHRVASALAAVAARLAGRDIGGPSPEAVEVAIAGYYRSLAAVSAQRRRVGTALGYSLLGWGALVASLYACGLAVGYRVPPAVAMVVVPVGGYATVLPLPGGLGGYELGVAGAIAVLAGVDVVTALAVTLLFRVCSYWLVIGLGAVASTALSVDPRRLVAPDVTGEGREAGPADR